MKLQTTCVVVVVFCWEDFRSYPSNRPPSLREVLGLLFVFGISVLDNMACIIITVLEFR